VVTRDEVEVGGFVVVVAPPKPFANGFEVLVALPELPKLTVGMARAGMVVVDELELVSENASDSVSTAASSLPPSSQPPKAATAVPARITASRTRSTPPRPRTLSPLP
jgi:hypothetical protein